MTETNEKSREALVRECKRIQENSLYTATAHFTSATTIGRLHHIVIGPIPIILGAISGWKGLTDPNVVGVQSSVLVPVLSLLTGVVGSVVAFWNLAELRMRHFTAGTAYKSLENDARRAWEIHAIDEELATLKKRVVELGERYNKLNESSIQTSDLAFARARKKIKAGVFVTDIEKREKKDKAAKTMGSGRKTQGDRETEGDNNSQVNVP